MVHLLLVFGQKDLCWVDRWRRLLLTARWYLNQNLNLNRRMISGVFDLLQHLHRASWKPSWKGRFFSLCSFLDPPWLWRPNVRKTRIQRPQRSGRRPRRPRREILATCKTFVCFESWRHNRESQFYCILTIDLFFSKLILFWEHFVIHLTYCYQFSDTFERIWWIQWSFFLF